MRFTGNVALLDNETYVLLIFFKLWRFEDIYGTHVFQNLGEG